ncbi:MAG: outer membrane lipoprotein chaperone LolA [Gammaproteobacteria bacterium]
MFAIKKSLLGFITALFFISAAQAESATDTLTGFLQNMRSMRADFTQTILDNKGHALQKSSGQMLLQRPNQFRWDVKSPIRQLIVTNGKRLWIYDPDLEQVTIRGLAKAAGETPAMLLNDPNLSLGKEFDVKAITVDSSALQWFMLTPKDKSTVISALQLGFANQIIQEMQLSDHLGHTTKITFNHVKLNVPLASNLFNFTSPAHVDVIDETKH